MIFGTRQIAQTRTHRVRVTTLFSVLASLIFTALGLMSLQAQQFVTPPVVLEDQFEQMQDVARLRGEVVVLIYGDRASANANRQLGEELHILFHPLARGKSPAEARKAPVRPVGEVGVVPGERLMAVRRSPDVLTIPIACVGKVPTLVQQLIRRQLRSNSPDIPVWIDFKDLMKAQFGLEPRVPNVVVLDVNGRYRHRETGAATPERVDRLARIVEQLRREAVQAK